MSTKYINLNNFDKIIKYANLLCPNKKNSKYTNKYYLTNIISILTDFVKWSSLKISKHIISNKKYHYKTIQKIHTLWSKKNIYGLVFNEIISNDNKYTFIIKIPKIFVYIFYFIHSHYYKKIIYLHH